MYYQETEKNMYSGVVYDKRNGMPIKNARVSDGKNICLTDSEGRFTLCGWERAHLIFVNILTTSHDDWYMLIDEGVESYDFYITPYETESVGSFAHISDTELCVGNTPCDLGAWGDFLKSCAESEKADFIIHTGDICRRAGLIAHCQHMNFKTMGRPVRYTLGNHDYVNDKYGEYTYETLYGPAWYSFDLGDVHYVILPIKNGETPSGYASSDSDEWLFADLSLKSPEKRLVVFCHEVACDKNFVMRDSGLDLKEYGVLAWVAGHYHNNYLWSRDGKYIITTTRPDCGGIDSTPPSVRIVRITDGGLISKILYNDISLADKSDKFWWRTQLSGEILFSSPIVSGGKIFVATSSDDTLGDTAIYCLDSNEGGIVWKCPTEAGIKNSITFVDGVIFAQDIFGTLYAIDSENGEIKYQKTLEIGNSIYTLCAPLYSNGVIYAGSSAVVTALSASNGRMIWTSGDKNTYDLAGASEFSIVGDLLVVGSHWKMLYALNINTGERVWENTDPHDEVSSNLVFGGNIIKPSRNTLYLIDSVSGKTLKSVTPEPTVDFNTVGAPFALEGKLYLSTANRGVVRFDAESFALEAEYPVGNPIVPTTPYATHDDKGAQNTPLMLGDKLVFAAPDGYVYFYEADTARLIRKISVGAPIYTSIAVCDGKIIVADLCGNVTAYEI